MLSTPSLLRSLARQTTRSQFTTFSRACSTKAAQSPRFQTSRTFTTQSSKMSPPAAEHKEAAKQQGHKEEEVEGELNEWKFREPYKIHTNEGFKALYEGSCHCGKVKYQLSREKPLASKYCHCTTCQRLHGAPFQWAAIFHKSDINFLDGHHSLGWYDSTSKSTTHHLPCKVSCSHCRTPIMDEGRNMILLFPTLIKFKSKEERDRFAPTCHMFYPQRAVDINDGKEKWTGINDESELCEDSPEEAKRELKRKRESEEKEKKNGKKNGNGKDE